MTGNKTIRVRVIPKAANNRVVFEEGTDCFRVYVTAVPEAGKANAAVLKLLSKHLNVPKSSMSVKRGATGRHKIIEICD